MKRLLVAAVATLLSCSGVHLSRVPATVSATLPLAGEIVAVVELGDATFAFTRDVVAIVRDGKIVAKVDAPTVDGHAAVWQAGVAIGAPDGEAWVVGIAGGALWRITPSGGVEDVDARLGVADAQVRAIASAGATSVIGLGDGAVVTTGGHVMRFTGEPASVVAAARDHVAIASRRAIVVFDLAHRTQVRYAISGATGVGFLEEEGPSPTLVAIAGGVVYQADGTRLVRVAAPAARRLVASGARLWLLAGDQLLAKDHHGAVVAVAAEARQAAIFPSRTTGVWLARATAPVVRYTLDAPRADPAWQAAVAPIVARVCARCHLPGGDADLD
ncbi:MAG: hypothetical protein NT062_13030, partial [Proteobacteria bacterium]|nr:hypothetical protein [Pseudomonadota bacterium]